MTVKISDVIIPEQFTKYTIQRTMEKSRLIQSGIMSANPELNILASSGGTIVNMPYWTDLTGDSEVLSDTSALTPGKIGSSKDMARLHARGRAWGVNDLAKSLSGDDPMGAISDMVAEYWNREQQKMLLKTLDGVFASAGMSGSILDISGLAGDLAKFNAGSFIDASYKLGDSESDLTAIMVHSITYASMRKQNLVEFVLDSQNANIPTYMGKTIIVDDSVPYNTGTGVATTYIFGSGAIGYGEGNLPVATEVDRDSLAGEDFLINRKMFLMHPRGVKWNEASVAGQFPTNDEVATAANWTKVYDQKAIKLVKFVHKI